MCAQVLQELPHRPPAKAEEEAAERIYAKTAQQMGRKMDTVDIKQLLYRNYEHPRWKRCGGALPDLRQLHDGLSNLFLYDRGRCHRSEG
jgi:hypothetical protein